MRTFNRIIEREPDTGIFVGHVPGWAGAHSQGATLDELQRNLQEVSSMLLEDGEPRLESEFVGVQTVRVAWPLGVIPVLKPREVAALRRARDSCWFAKAAATSSSPCGREMHDGPVPYRPRRGSDVVAQDRARHRLDRRRAARPVTCSAAAVTPARSSL